MSSWDELATARRAMDSRMEDWARDVTEEWLAETMSYVSVNDGKTRILPRWVLVTHMFNHGTHHRGQLTTLMKQLGIEPGVTDLPWLPALYDGTVLSADSKCDRSGGFTFAVEGSGYRSTVHSERRCA